jgi:PAS domain-containing protein
MMHSASLARERSAIRLKVLVAFGAALAATIIFPAMAYRAASASGLSTLLIAGSTVRTLIVVLALLVLWRDMAARERAEDELRSSRDAAMEASEGRRVAQAESEKLGERLRAVLDHIDVGVVMVELNGSISVFNTAAERICGAWREQIEELNRAGTHPSMLEDEKTVIAPGEDPLGLALKGQTVRDARLFYRTPFRPNGCHLRVSAVPLRDHHGLLVGAVLMFTEVGRATGER